MSNNNALKQFRIAAIAEGFSWLGLLVTMALKYGFDMPEPNKWVGYIHGFLFIIYCFYIAYFLFEEKWPFVRCLILFLTAFLPFGTFWAERKYLRYTTDYNLVFKSTPIKLLKKILFSLLFLIALLLVIARFIPKEILVSRSIKINRTQTEVFYYVKQLNNQPKYGVWWKADPNMKVNTSGTDGKVGFVHAWDSKVENVGAGQQKIIAIDSSARKSKISIELKFIRPFESVNPSYIETNSIAADKQTEVTWAITSKMPYPFNLMGALMNMEEILGNDLEKGLKNLKVLLEKEDY